MDKSKEAELPREGGVRCKVRTGMFSEELTVELKLYPEGTTSVLVDKEVVEAPRFPTDDETVDGTMKVQILFQFNGYARIALPRPSIDGKTLLQIPKSELVSN